MILKREKGEGEGERRRDDSKYVERVESGSCRIGSKVALQLGGATATRFASGVVVCRWIWNR